MPQAPSSRPRSSRRRRRVLTLPPDAVPRITTTSGPDLTAPLAPVLTRSAHFLVLVMDAVGAVLSSGLWISSFVVALTLATIMHFLDYGRSHRATEFSGAISLPYEAAKWVLNLVLRLVPNVSRTLAKVLFIACFALCSIDFGVWCIVALYRVLFNKASPDQTSPDPILATPLAPAQRESLEPPSRRPRFYRSPSKLASSSQSPSPTACGPALPPPVQCELSPSSSSSSSLNTPSDLSPDLASSSDTFLSSSSHSRSSGDIISSAVTESSSDSYDSDSFTSEEVYIFKAYRPPKVVRRKAYRAPKVARPQTRPKAPLSQAVDIHKTNDDHATVADQVTVDLVQKRPVHPAVADIKVKAVRDFVMSLADARVVPTPVLTSTTVLTSTAVDSRLATNWAPTIRHSQVRSLPLLRTGTPSPGRMPLHRTLSGSNLMRPEIHMEQHPAALSRVVRSGPSPFKYPARPERREETTEEACRRHIEYYRQREADAYWHFIVCLDGSGNGDDTAHLPDDFIPPTPDSLQPHSPPHGQSDFDLITCRLELVSLRLTEYLVLEGDLDALEEYFDYDLYDEADLAPLSVSIANEKWRINVSDIDIKLNSWENGRPRRAGVVTVAAESEIKIKKQKKSVRWADPVDDGGVCPFNGPIRGPSSAKAIRRNALIDNIIFSGVNGDNSRSGSAAAGVAKPKAARRGRSAEDDSAEVYGSGSHGSATLFVTVEDCLGRDWAMKRRR